MCIRDSYGAGSIEIRQDIESGAPRLGIRAEEQAEISAVLILIEHRTHEGTSVDMGQIIQFKDVIAGNGRCV